MTKRHFEAFAAQIKARRAEMAGAFGYDEMIGLVCDVAQQFNERFDRERFVAACGGPVTD